jgi:ribosomal protein S18 acetylase RimI-like enzyme
LIGFLSQTSGRPYIHFVRVHPDYRKQGIGKQLYNEFFHIVKKNGRNIVRCVTLPVNKVSIAFHKKMGFEIEKNGDKEMDGASVYADYDGPNQDRVLFVKRLI